MLITYPWKKLTLHTPSDLDKVWRGGRYITKNQFDDNTIKGNVTVTSPSSSRNDAAIRGLAEMALSSEGLIATLIRFQILRFSTEKTKVPKF